MFVRRLIRKPTLQPAVRASAIALACGRAFHIGDPNARSALLIATLASPLHHVSNGPQVSARSTIMALSAVTTDVSAGPVAQETAPASALRPEQLNPRLVAHHGVPSSASILAYEPVQRLLAVGTRIGQIKVFGGQGVEALLQSPNRAPCRLLEFVPNRGRLIQITTRNNIEVWDLCKQELVASTTWETDVTALAVAAASPYFYIGEETGNMHVMRFDEDQQHLQAQPYFVPAHATLGKNAHDVWLLLVYANGLMVLWSLHEVRAVAIRGGTASQRRQLQAHTLQMVEGASLSKEDLHESESWEDDEEEHDICTACWACAEGSIAAVGYTDGDVVLWQFPTPNERLAGTEMLSGDLAEVVQLTAGAPRVPVTILKWCGSGGSNTRGHGRLYICGGGDLGLPEEITVLSLSAGTDGEHLPETSRTHIPWLGPVADIILLPNAASDLAVPAAAVVVLTTPGQVHLYDEKNIVATLRSSAGQGPPLSIEPVPLQPPVSDSYITTAKAFVFSNELQPILGKLVKLPREDNWHPAKLPAGTRWPILGGLPSSSNVVHQPAVYMTGHRDGRLQLWDVSSPLLSLVTTVPHPQVAEGSGMHEMTCFEWCSAAGVLATAHSSGQVFLYQWSSEERSISLHKIGAAHLVMKCQGSNCGPGFQLFMDISIHPVPISALALATAIGRLAIGDKLGGVSIVDLMTCSVLTHFTPVPTSGVAVLAFVFLPLTAEGAPVSNGHQHHRSEKKKGMEQSPQGSTGPVLVVTGRMSEVVILDANSGSTLGAGAFQPKYPSQTVHLLVLDNRGNPISQLSGNFNPVWALGAKSEVLTEPDAGSRETGEQVVTEKSDAQHGYTEIPESQGLSGRAALDQLREYYSEGLLTPNHVRLQTQQGVADVVQEVMRRESSTSLAEGSTHGSERSDTASEVEVPSTIFSLGSLGSEGHAKESTESLAPDDEQKRDHLGTVPGTGEAASVASPSGQTSGSDLLANQSGQDVVQEQKQQKVGEVGEVSTSRVEVVGDKPAHDMVNVEVDSSEVTEVEAPTGVKPLEAASVCLISQDWLRVYSMSAIFKVRSLTLGCSVNGERKSLKKIRLHESGCAWAASCGDDVFPSALTLLSRAGDLEIRSFSDMAVNYERSIQAVTGSEYEHLTDLLPSMTCTADGRITCVRSNSLGAYERLGGDSELLQLSLFHEENALRVPESLPNLHDKMLAEAADAAAAALEAAVAVASPPTTSSSSHAPLQRHSAPEAKRWGLFEDIKGVVSNVSSTVVAVGTTVVSIPQMAQGKEKKLSSEGSSKEQRRPAHTAAELSDLFASQPFALVPVPEVEAHEDPFDGAPSPRNDPSINSVEEILGEGSVPIRLVIEELPQDTPDAEPVVPDKKPNRPSGLFGSRLFRNSRSEKGKGPEGAEASPRAELLGDAMPSPKGETKARAEVVPGNASPHLRSAEDIKAAYGRKSAWTDAVPVFGTAFKQDAAQAASLARDRLVERGEKLEDLQKHTEELEAGAENFGSMADELVKKMEGRKWWKDII
eukprot:SM000139S00123  [mRNA]  locus=s139:219620:229335:- [translate_table: standard]